MKGSLFRAITGALIVSAFSLHFWIKAEIDPPLVVGYQTVSLSASAPEQELFGASLGDAWRIPEPDSRGVALAFAAVALGSLFSRKKND